MIRNFRFLSIKISEQSLLLSDLEKIDSYLKNNQNLFLSAESICIFGQGKSQLFLGREIGGLDSSLEDEKELFLKDFYEMELIQTLEFSSYNSFNELIKDLTKSLDENPSFDFFILKTLTLAQSELSLFKRVK